MVTVVNFITDLGPMFCCILFFDEFLLFTGVLEFFNKALSPKINRSLYFFVLFIEVGNTLMTTLHMIGYNSQCSRKGKI